jgi:hypothetical protein
MKRTALAAACALSLTAVLTACGGGDDADAKPENSPSSAKPKQLTPEQRLAKLMVTKAESGGYTLEEPSTEEAFAKSTDEVTVDKPACAPLVYAMNDLPLGDPTGRLTRVTNGGGSSSMLTYVTLSTYEDGKAEAAMKDLTAAASSCANGFTATSKTGGTTAYDSAGTETAPKAGDESLATSATFEYQGFPQTLRTQTFRFGDTIANYFTLDSGAYVPSPRPGNAEIPADLVTAQNKKLG